MTRSRRAALVAALVTAALVAGCGGGADVPSAGPSSAAPPATTAQPDIAEPTAVAVPVESVVQEPPAPGPDQVDNPMVRLAALAERIASEVPRQERPRNIVVDGYVGTFADPDITRVDGRWYAYATNTAQRNVPTLVSDDLRSWNLLETDALPQVGSWVQGRGAGRGLWAPGIQRIGGGWTMAYSAQFGTVGGQRHNCIGLARGESPTGPFRHLGNPLACDPSSRQGVIDPDLHVDRDGKAWMLWKYSGAHQRRPAGIFSRQLNAAGTDWAPGSQTYEVLTFQGGWEGDTIENPSMITFRDVTYLFYSANFYTTAAYATGYAICEGPAGPCGRPSPGPLLDSRSTGHLGPGGASAFEADRSLRLAYHAWEPGRVGSLRRLRIAGLWQRPDLTLELVNAG